MIEYIKNSLDKLTAEANQRRILNLPNGITMLRVGIIPVLFFLLSDPGRMWSLIIAILFIMAALTDLLDGYVARKYHIVTNIGKFLDPIADKIIINAAMILMIPIGRIPAWIVSLIIIRDFIV
ncbi:MAG TPA: CDP-alcohol phosphatidyltransferase family protein, partial [Syntrophales bacterium]|nr:CDP-alcohol phosphatidyltransferase family protein [Syntrophales bacterium]